MIKLRWLAKTVLITVFFVPSAGFGQAVNISGGAEDRNIVVQSLRRNPPQTAVEVSRAILYMHRIERWDEVARYLDQLAKLPIDEGTALSWTRAAGLETWFALGQQTEKLSEVQRATVRKVIDLSSGATRNPATIQKAVGLLRSTELVDRKRGVLAIQAAGETGLSAMLESIASTDRPPTPIMSETIITMQFDGESALKAAISSSEGDSFAKLMIVAARIPGGSYMTELASAIHLLAPDSEAYKQIRETLSPSGQALPQPLASQRFISDQMESELIKYRSLRLDLTASVNSVWRWTPDGKRLVTEIDDSAGLHLERAYQLALLTNRLASQTGVHSALATAVILERHHRLNPTLDIEPSALQSLFKPTTQFEDLNFLGLVWNSARKAELLAAELRSVQAIGQALKKTSSDTAPTIRILSDAVKNSAPAVRYLAAIALHQRPGSDEAFEGRYAFEQTKREMQNLEAKPLALLIGGSTELSDSLSSHLSLLGIRTLIAKSARETMRLIQEPQPIEYVFLVDRVLEMSLSEVVQRIRIHPRTRTLPLAVLTEQLGTTQRELLANEGVSRIHYGAVTTKLDLTAALLTEMRATSPIPKMDSIDRITFRSILEISPNP